MKKFAVSVIDYSDSADGKARVLDIFRTRSQAVDYVRSDMDDHIEDYKMEGYEEDELDYDYDSMSFSVAGSGGCEWNIEEVEVPGPTDMEIRNAKQILIDNGIEADEAATVLQAIGYALIDTELYPEDSDDEYNEGY